MTNSLVLALLLSLLAACKSSSAELAERAAEMDAAAMRQAHAANAARVAAAAAEASAVAARQSSATQVSNAVGGCRITAERAIARLAACGLNVDGFTPENLCPKMGQPKLNYLASRSCDEIATILNLKD